MGFNSAFKGLTKCKWSSSCVHAVWLSSCWVCECDVCHSYLLISSANDTFLLREFIHSFVRLSYDRTAASSETSSVQSVIRYFLFTFPVPFSNKSTNQMQQFLKFITWRLLVCTAQHLDDWLTVRRSITLADFQLDAQNSYLFTYNTFIKILYMFRALLCSSSGGLRRNCIYAASGIVTLCRWLSCAPVKKELS